ncbi:MAG: winged helix-turn-helix domain-containing protein, partial [Kangiellaceae bacterium]|nr:winged helix-turn-helix domain-containing protein [Kangiellaceae bacterium]
LTYLAKNANKVVSHDELFAEVWPDTVVTPNTLQRSIAQLRKALGEDRQYQSYIKTHAKKGYSLEVEVQWQDINDAESLVKQDILSNVNGTSDVATKDPDIAIPQIEAEDKSTSGKEKSLKSALNFFVMFAGIIIIGFFGTKYLTPKPALSFSVGELRALTATDNKELAGIYSPDGEYIVFLRYSNEFCVNNIWAKHTKTQQETKLTQNMGSFGSHSFSKDGKKLVFIETANCAEPITQKKCYKLMSFDFEKALKEPQSPSVYMECKNSRITRPKWMNNSNIALMQEFDNRWKLTSYSIQDNKSHVIFEVDDGNIIDFDYSVNEDLIALTSVHSDGQHYIEILKPDGQLLSSHQIKYPKEITVLRNLYPNFTPQKGLLIFSTGRQLFTLSYEGKVTNISLPLDESMGTPTFHPDGQRALVIKGHYDSDIVRLPRSQFSSLQTDKILAQETPIYSTIERSIAGEDNAIFQPNGDLIAFVTSRSGEAQVWTTVSNGVRQLTSFPIDTYIAGMQWAADGNSIMVNANQKLSRIFLNSTQEEIPFAHPIVQLFDWNSDDNTAVISARIRGISKLVSVNLNNAEYTIINHKKVNWAIKTEDGRLIYTDNMDRFWQPGPAEDQLIESLKNQGSDKRYVTKNNVIYGINEDFQLWSYDLIKESFEILGDAPNNVDDITDVNQTDFLLSIRISAKKEVAELTLSD